MQRPTSLFGLLRHAIALRWQALSPMGRKAAMVLGVVSVIGAVGAWRASSCECASGCPYQRAAMTGEPMLPEATEPSADVTAHAAGEAEAHTGCRFSR